MPVLSRLFVAGRRVSPRHPTTPRAKLAPHPQDSRTTKTAQPGRSTRRYPRMSEFAGRTGSPSHARLLPRFLPRPDRPSPQSQSLSRSYGSGLPTSLTYIILFNQRLFTLETCCGHGYGQQRKSSFCSPVFSRAGRSTPDTTTGAVLSGTGNLPRGINPLRSTLP